MGLDVVTLGSGLLRLCRSYALSYHMEVAIGCVLTLLVVAPDAAGGQTWPTHIEILVNGINPCCFDREACTCMEVVD